MEKFRKILLLLLLTFVLFNFSGMSESTEGMVEEDIEIVDKQKKDNENSCNKQPNDGVDNEGGDDCLDIKDEENM